jgi:hypothetical protein
VQVRGRRAGAGAHELLAARAGICIHLYLHPFVFASKLDNSELGDGGADKIKKTQNQNIK